MGLHCDTCTSFGVEIHAFIIVSIAVVCGKNIAWIVLAIELIQGAFVLVVDRDLTRSSISGGEKLNLFLSEV